MGAVCGVYVGYLTDYWREGVGRVERGATFQLENVCGVVYVERCVLVCVLGSLTERERWREERWREREISVGLRVTRVVVVCV